ncbi:MAG: sugar phosphate isomerase/epimerase [Chthoniobacterales bacterium]|nr:sugar phosphate isomerase/epimerase [Chthoniobacterales bacterium]
MDTRTGNFAIGFRRGWTDWQKDLKSLSNWAKETGFDAIDLGKVTNDDAQTMKSAGVKLGSVDVIGMGQLMDNDAGKRKDLIAQNVAYVKEAAALGAKAFFTCIIPGDPAKKREENYRLAVDVFSPIADACAQNGAALAVEGWPGGGPWFANMCCTPETTRAFLKDVGAGAGLNYDPSHLIRLRVDHIRFLNEFIGSVKHVHAKDTEVDEDALYEFGTQTATFVKGHGFGGPTWRYTIPGHGIARWLEIFRVLEKNEYDGIVSVELEDENFNGTDEGEKAALKHSLAFLRGA